MLPFVIAIIFAVLGIVFPFLFFAVIKRRLFEALKDDSYADLKASVIFLQAAFPTVIFLLGAFGFQSYGTIVNTVSERVTEQVIADISPRLKESVVDSLIAEIEAGASHVADRVAEIDRLRVSERIKSDTALADLDSLVSNGKQRVQYLNTIAADSLLSLLPKGTIIAWRGEAKIWDPAYWAVCDGRNGTPDLTGRFLMGATIGELETTGGGASHTHDVELTLNVDKGHVTRDGYNSGTETPFEVEYHDHTVELGGMVVSQSVGDLPPYHGVVFLMKIR